MILPLEGNYNEVTLPLGHWHGLHRIAHATLLLESNFKTFKKNNFILELGVLSGREHLHLAFLGCSSANKFSP
jgi:hypothetical protein